MLSPWKESYEKLRQHIKKQRHYFADKDPCSQSYDCAVVMDGCEIWTIKKTKCWRIDAFELWCNRRLLRVPWTAERSSQSVLKEINPEYSLEGLILKLKRQYFGYLIWRAKSLEKIKGKRRRGQQRMRWLDSITNSTDMNVSKLREIPEDRGAWRIAVYGVAKGWTWPSDWTTTRAA